MHKVAVTDILMACQNYMRDREVLANLLYLCIPVILVMCNSAG